MPAPAVPSLDSTSIKASPDATGALKNGQWSIVKTRGGSKTKIHAIIVILSWLLRCPYRQETCMTRHKVERSFGILQDAFQNQVF